MPDGGAPSLQRPFSRLAGLLDSTRPVVVQTHDYPDIDAVASAWALAELLAGEGFEASSVYRGEIRSRSLARLVAELGITVSRIADGAGGDVQVIIVDGSPTNGNVSPADGRLVGVIDHHCKSGEPAAPFVDIRPGLASSSTLVFEYWEEAGERPGRGLATALLAGIQSDTDFLSRRSSPEDFRAYSALFGLGDWELSSRIVRTVLDLGELGRLARALSDARIEGDLLYATVDGPCEQEALAVLADFALRAEELRAAVAASRDPAGVHLSVRSKNPALSAFDLVRRALAGIGSGGGHSHSAGGLVPAASGADHDAIRDRFFAASADMAAGGAAVARRADDTVR